MKGNNGSSEINKSSEMDLGAARDAVSPYTTVLAGWSSSMSIQTLNLAGRWLMAFLAQYVERACLTKKSLERHFRGRSSCCRTPCLEPMFPTSATVIAILAICVLPVYAQGQRPDTVKLKADAQNAFRIISSDKLKTRSFCEMADLGNQLDQADRMHDTKKTKEVSQKLDELERKLPEYTALVGGLMDVDPNSPDGQEIGSIILKLDELCD
jgi:hypothetical protein